MSIKLPNETNCKFDEIELSFIKPLDEPNKKKHESANIPLSNFDMSFSEPYNIEQKNISLKNKEFLYSKGGLDIWNVFKGNKTRGESFHHRNKKLPLNLPNPQRISNKQLHFPIDLKVNSTTKPYPEAKSTFEKYVLRNNILRPKIPNTSLIKGNCKDLILTASTCNSTKCY